MTVWLCRAGLKGEYENKFVDQKKIFLIGSVSLDLTGKTDMDELMGEIGRAYPTEPDGSVTTMSVQARAFATKVKVGDWVVLPSMGEDKLLNIGEITGEYKYDGTRSELKHMHSVDWNYGAWKRSSFDEDIIRSVDAFDSFMLFFKLRQEKRIKEIVGRDQPFAPVGLRVDKPAEPVAEPAPAFDDSEIKEIIAEVKETITQVKKSNLQGQAEVKKMISEVMDVIDEVRATITEVKKATLTEAAEVKKVIAEVRDAIDDCDAHCCCCCDGEHGTGGTDRGVGHGAARSAAQDDYDDEDDNVVYSYNEWYYDSLRARRRLRR
ncbi:MAG: hypothetical protein LBE47_00410 [Methanomassiliicoccaceae archaeon]|jgi:predicted Mrr-cat superfamily restriction endonuclease|nr:hypothetical protein [Methanomassiliicoccaceae archaeon]